MSAEASAPGNDGLEPIRQVKTIESETQAKLSAQQARAKEEIDALTRDADATVIRARQEAEAARDAVLAASRADADREAEQILAEGQQRAGRIQGKSPAELQALKEPILGSVLGEFRPKGKRAEA